MQPAKHPHRKSWTIAAVIIFLVSLAILSLLSSQGILSLSLAISIGFIVNALNSLLAFLQWYAPRFPDENVPAIKQNTSKSKIASTLMPPSSIPLNSTQEGQKNISVQQKERDLSKNVGALLYTYQGHTEEVNALCWSPDGNYIASGGKEIHIWQVATGTCLAVYKGHAQTIKAMKWSRDGKYIVSQDEEAIHIWEAGISKNHSNKPGTYVPQQCTKIALPVISKQNVASLSLVPPMDISPDGLRLIIGNKVYNSFTGNHILDIGTNLEALSSVAWSPSGQDIAISHGDSNVTIFSAQTGRMIDWFSRDLDETIVKQTLAIIGEVNALSWSPDGKYIAFGGEKRVIQLWEPLLGHFSPRGRPRGRNGPGIGDRHEDNDLSRYYGHSETIVCLAWSSDGKYLASLSKDSVLQLWKPFTRSVLYMRKGYPSKNCGSTSIAWAPDSSCIASISEGRIIEVWKVYDAIVENIDRPAKMALSNEVYQDRKQFSTHVEAQVKKTQAGALVIYTEEELVTQPVYLTSHRKWQLAPPIEKKDLKTWSDEALQNLQRLQAHQRPNPIEPGKFYPDVKVAIVKRERIDDRYICAAIFLNLSPDDYLVWIEPDKPLSAPAFAGKATAVDLNLELIE